MNAEESRVDERVDYVRSASRLEPGLSATNLHAVLAYCAACEGPLNGIPELGPCTMSGIRLADLLSCNYFIR